MLIGHLILILSPNPFVYGNAQILLKYKNIHCRPTRNESEPTTHRVMKSYLFGAIWDSMYTLVLQYLLWSGMDPQSLAKRIRSLEPTQFNQTLVLVTLYSTLAFLLK
jgi:hypothetical protein